MTRRDLDQFLNKGYQLGFVKSTDDPQFLGWILLQKVEPDDRYVGLLQPGEEPEYMARQELYRSNPYLVRVVELKRDVFENDRYETEDDYRLHQRYYFSNLDEVEKFVASFGDTLEDIKWLTEINAP